jgi:hypothetical protein
MQTKNKTYIKFILDYGRGHKRKKSSDTLIHTITGNSSLFRYEKLILKLSLSLV